MAATTAVYQSGKGKPTLLVSTDPAGNLGDIFERKVGVEPILVAPNLSVVQMDLAAHIGTGETLVVQIFKLYKHESTYSMYRQQLPQSDGTRFFTVF